MRVLLLPRSNHFYKLECKTNFIQYQGPKIFVLQIFIEEQNFSSRISTYEFGTNALAQCQLCEINEISGLRNYILYFIKHEWFITKIENFSNGTDKPRSQERIHKSHFMHCVAYLSVQYATQSATIILKFQSRKCQVQTFSTTCLFCLFESSPTI